MSLPHLSTEQRVQQLESTVIDLMTQVSGLKRELQAARTQQQGLQVACDSYQFAEQYIRAEISQMDREAWEREQRRKVRGDEASVHWNASPASVCHVCTRRAFHSCLGSD